MARAFLATISGIALLSSAALAQTGGGAAPGSGGVVTPGAAQGATVRGSTANLVPDLTRAQRILGQYVFSANGDRLGDIEDLVIDPRTGRIEMVVLGVGGFLGMGEKKVAVPFNQISVRAVADARAPGGVAGRDAAGNPTTTVAGGGTTPGGAITVSPPGMGAAGGMIRADADRMRLVVDMSQDQLRAAPEFRDGNDRDRPTAPGGTNR